MKQKAKAFFEPPERKKALTVVILFLVFGTAMGFALVDKDTSGSADNPTEYDEQTLFGSYQYDPGTGYVETWVSKANQNVLYPSEYDGFFMFDTGTSSLARIGWTMGNFGEKFGNSIHKMVVTTPLDVGHVYLQGYGSGADNYPTLKYYLTEVSSGIWEYEFSAAELLIMKQYPSFSFYFTGITAPADGVVEFSIELFDNPTAILFMPYVAAIAGVLILICAFYALPHVSPGVSVKAAKYGHMKAKKTYSNVKNSIKSRKGGKK